MAHLISDSDLWRFLRWEPTSPDEHRAQIPIWRRSSQANQLDNRPSQAWIDWAKSEILDGPKDRSAGSEFVCRMLRILEAVHVSGVEDEVLKAATLVGIMLAGDGRKTSNDALWADQYVYHAIADGFISEKGKDTWYPGMPSGSGWKRFLRLTLAGQYLAEQHGVMPAFRDGSQPEDTPRPLPEQGATGPDAPVRAEPGHAVDERPREDAAEAEQAEASEISPARAFWQKYQLFFDADDHRFKLREMDRSGSHPTMALQVGRSKVLRNLLNLVLGLGKSRCLTHDSINTARDVLVPVRERSLNHLEIGGVSKAHKAALIANQAANRKQIQNLNDKFAEAVGGAGDAPPNAFQPVPNGWTWFFRVTRKGRPAR